MKKVQYEEICMPDILDRVAAQYPDRMALNFQGYTMNYKALKDMVDRFAACLAGMGIKKNDAVAIILPNMIPCVAAYYAIHKLGAIVVLNNPTYSDRELEHQLNDSGSKVLITVDLLANRMIDLRPKTKVKQIIITSIGDYLPFPVNLLFPLVGKKKGLLPSNPMKPAADVYQWKDCIAKNQPNPPKVKLTFDDTAMYQYTGGTTGVSKGVILTHGNISKQVQQIRAWFPRFIGTYHINLGALPFFHVFGMSCAMNFSIMQGWGDILIPKPQPQPVPDGCLALIAPGETPRIVAKGICFANGVAVDAKEEHVYVAETMKRRVLRYPIQTDNHVGPAEVYGPDSVSYTHLRRRRCLYM